MIDFFAVFGNSRFESRYNDGDTFWVDGSGRLREGKMGIVRRCQWDSISKKGFKGFGWILEIMEIKTWAVRLRLCRLAQTNFVKIRSYQGERAASYKGVVINGHDGRQEQNKEDRDHQGKGKGKMYEEDEAKWVRVSGRGNKKLSADRSRFRGEELDSRHRRPRYELTRNSFQEGRYRLFHGMKKCSLNKESPQKEIEVREARTERGGERAASYKGVVINGHDGRQEQNKEDRDHQGKGKGKMYEEDEEKWVCVSGRGNKKLSADRSRIRGEELDSRHRRPRYELTRNSFQEGRYRSQGYRGMRRERSPRDHFPEQERSKGRTYEGTMRSTQLSGAGETQQEVHSQRDGDVILAHVNGLGSDQVRMGNEKVENGLDVVNEVMLEQDNLVKADDMDTDENNSSLKEGEVTNGGEEEFQDVTDEEIDGNQGVTQGDIVASIEMSEEGELEKAENVGGGEKNRVKKKLFKGGPLVVGTSKMRMVHSLISPRKRLPSKPNPKQVNEEIDGNQGVTQGDIVASVEMSEEGELEKAENVGGGEKNIEVKKKLFKGGPLVVGTSKMRMVHSLISPRKRLPSKPNPKQGDGMKQGDGTKQGAEQGTSNPKPPINKH
ncbi:hypothetical protein F2Q70_00030164 [Brassica cretica]|uniref:Uncharacterized protein n=1 Tax=Brassica cretica TaxID=69181 RepID=A0A8S9FGF0_BRACR|nr:hypothetical protein F2Q70_00030164 [Brassica cretica]